MTSQQINYWKVLNDIDDVKETQRHNRAVESEAVRHNEAGERLEAWSISEASRHNQAYEQETQRHNIAQEAETQRHQRQQDLVAAKNFIIDYGVAGSKIALDESNIALNKQNTAKAVRETDLAKFKAAKTIGETFLQFVEPLKSTFSAAAALIG